MKKNKGFTLTISTLALISLWVAIIPIYSFGYQVAMRLRFFCTVICMIYILSNFSARLFKRTWYIWVYAIATFISSVSNYGLWSIRSLINDLSHPFSVLSIFLVPLIAADRYDIKRVAKVFFGCGCIYLIPTFVTVIIAGRVDAGWFEPYFVGNKFILTYYMIVMFCCWGIIHSDEILTSLTMKIKVVILCIIGIGFSIYLYCITGVVCYLTALIFVLVLPIRKLFEKPLGITLSVLFSGLLPLSMATIINIPRINSFLAAINETATMNARIRIYDILMNIIVKKFWWGYGYNSLIVKERLYSNAQNGLLHIMVQFGVIGVILLLFICYMVTRSRNRANSVIIEWSEIWMFAFIVAGIIEITFGVFFYVILSLINCVNCARDIRGINVN